MASTLGSPPVQSGTGNIGATFSNEWTTGIFDCGDDVNSAARGLCCFPYSALSIRASLNSKDSEDISKLQAALLCIPTYFCGIWCFASNIELQNRRVIRGELNLPKDDKNDIMSTFLCCCCSNAQHAREINERRRNGWRPSLGMV